jgi:cytochrome c-type biogenesis protein
LIGPLSLLLALLAGVLTIVNPCVLPLAPILIAGARARDGRGPLAMAAGLALTFGLVGGSLAALGIEFGEAVYVRAASAAILIVVGLVMLLPALGHRGERLLAPAAGLADALDRRLPNAGLWGQAGAGAVLALAWAPCVGPTLGAAFALAASGGSLASSMAVMTIFALGAATSLLAAGYGLGRLTSRGRRIAGGAGRIGRSGLGLAFALVGAAILTGFDQKLEAAVVESMPNWLVSFATRL